MKIRGSLTVEAAFVLPFLLLVFGMVMSSGINLYTECMDTAAAIRDEQEFDAVGAFYQWQRVGDIFGDGDSIY